VNSATHAHPFARRHRGVLFPGLGRRRRFAFTLIEVMIVVAIMGIVVTMSVPMVYKVWRREPLNKAVRDVVEVLSNARAQAIMQGRMVELLLYPQERRMAVSGFGGAPQSQDAEPWSIEEKNQISLDAGSGMSAVIDEQVTIEMMDVNLIEYKDAEFARVRFYPNGTCDEMTLILHSDKGDWLKISLEVTTSLASVGPVNR
jgi:type II secretion system protein H